MKLIIAEKPSVAREIAHIVGADMNETGYMYGGDYTVTWAMGHLVTLAMPEAYGVVGFNKEHLPILPEHFKLSVRQVKAANGWSNDPVAVKQLKIIKSLFDAAESIIVATDAGREGELIFRYIYDFLGCRKPFERLWISSLTESSIRSGLDNLKRGSEYDNLYYSAKARSEADWLIGINATQALTVTASVGTYSLGRVQTPTLVMIYNRFMESRGFQSIPYWRAKAEVDVKGETLTFTTNEKYEKEEEAEAALWEMIDVGTITIESIESKEVREEPPLLYDLTSRQKEMNRKYVFSADKTLQIAQRLYEAQLITYPRTGSSYIPKDVADEIFATFKYLQEDSYIIMDIVESFCNTLTYPRSVNEKKITDHHAIIVTDKEHKELTKDEEIVYKHIGARVVEAFSCSCIKEIVTVTAVCESTKFQATITTIHREGWRAVCGIEDEERCSVDVNSLSKGDRFAIAKREIVKRSTKPKPLHTEGTLLSAMESAGKELENEAERQAIKDSGIGTPATRASIIETLFNRNYIRREGKSLVPTDKGIAVCKVVCGKQISDAQMTGMWEAALTSIEKGELDANAFSEGVKVLTSQITRELLNSEIEHKSKIDLTCPKCGAKTILIFDKVVKCSDKECNFTLFRNICSKQLTERDITDLLTKGKTRLIKGFVSKAGKSFSAALLLDRDYNLILNFDKKR